MNFDISKIEDFAGNIIGSIIVIIAAIILWKIFSRITKKNLDKFSDAQGKTVTYIHFIYNIIKYVIIALTIVVILQINGVNVSSLVVGLGVVATIIGLSLQDELKDAIMGVHFVTDDFFHVGDIVEYNGVKGKVLTYNMKFVRLESIEDGGIITICNRNITQITRYPCDDVKETKKKSK